MSGSAQIVAVGCVNAIEEMRDNGTEITRALLREARDILRGAREFKQRDGSIRIYALIQPDCDLAARIDAALEKR